MRTSKPISSISYNSIEYLQSVLNKLQDKGIIAYWCAVKHIGEVLEDGTKEKDHLHVYIEPNRLIDTLKLQEQTCELDHSNPTKPLRCISFRTSKWDDWVWYGLHDSDYLASKGEIRQYTYTKDDFIYRYDDEFNERFNEALHSSDVARSYKAIKALKDGASVNTLAFMGFISPQQAFHYQCFDKMLRQGAVEYRRIQDEQQRLKELNTPLEREKG